MTRLLLLAGAGLLYGAASGYIFRRFTNAGRMGRSIDRILARVLEFRLFIDEPAVVLRAQGALIVENLRLLRQIAIPCALMAIPSLLLYPAMDRHFGHGPLQAGESIVVTAPLISDSIELRSPAGVVVETPGVRALVDHQISWRARALRTSGQPFELTDHGRVIHAALDVGYPHMTWLPWFFAASVGGAWIQTRRRMRRVVPYRVSP